MASILLACTILVFINEALCQSNRNCRCSQIDECMQDLSFTRKATLLSCRQQCLDSFINADKNEILQCYVPRDEKFLAVSNQMVQCMERELGRPCKDTVSASTSTTRGRKKRVAYGIMGQMFGLDFPQSVKDFERCTISCMKVNGTSPGPLMMSFNAGNTRQKSFNNFVEESHERFKRGTAIGSSYHFCAQKAGCDLVASNADAISIRRGIVKCLNELPLNTDEELVNYCQCMARTNIGPVDCVMDQNSLVQVVRVNG